MSTDDPKQDYRIVKLVDAYEDYTNSNLPMCETRGGRTGTAGHGVKRRAEYELRRKSTGSILARTCERCIPAFVEAYGFDPRPNAGG